MKYDYKKIIDLTNRKLLVHQEDEFIYFLNPNPDEGSLLLEECDDHIIIWNNELKDIDYKLLYSNFIRLLPVNIYVVFIESIEEYNAVVELGGEKIDFTCDDSEGYSMKYGSFILKK